MTGLICIDKPAGITSFGTVAKVKGILHEKKAGHTGTLDPMATGVLPVMLGDATRFLEYLPDSDKGYRASFLLGKTTDTLDITGAVTGEYPVDVTAEQVRAALAPFRGTIRQLPPMYSAKSKDGVRLYELARQGIEVEREACEVTVRRLELVGETDGEYTIDVLCSKGTYIRSLIDDIGRALGCGAVMTALRRTQATGFTLQDCITLEDLQRLKDSGGDLTACVIPLEQILQVYETVSVTPAQAKRFANGGALDADRVQRLPETGALCRVTAPTGELLGLGRNDGEALRPVRLLPQQG